MSRTARLILLTVILLFISYYFWIKPVVTMQNQQSKATWLWHTSQITERPEDILAFLDQQHVSTLFLQINTKLPEDSYRNFIRMASGHGIEVHALGGAPSWAIESKSVNSFFSWIAQYQSIAEEGERFAGVHLDIEPYLLPQWKTDYQTLVEEYQGNISLAYDKSAYLNLPLGIDIPFWFDNRRYTNSFGEGLLSEWLINHADEVTVMAYRNKANGSNGIIQLAKTEMAYANEAGKPLWIGVETASTSEGKHLSFYEKDARQMEEQLRQTEKAFSRYNEFEGVAVHSLESWMNRK